MHRALHSTQMPYLMCRIGPRQYHVAYFYGHSGDLLVRKLRGRHSRTASDFFRELGAALQLFAEFGENWMATEEVLMYMDEWLPAIGYVLVIEDAGQFLADSSDLPLFVRVVYRVGEWWSRPIVDNGRFNRSAKPFHVVLELADDAELNRFEEAGATVKRLGTWLP